MLLVMQKTTDILTSVSTQTEKYSTVEDLIISKFTTEKTLQLLHRSASYLASNPVKISEWVNFIDNSFSGILYESAKLLVEAKNLEKIKNDLVEKLKVSEEYLVSLDFERKEISEQLQTETDLKIHLAQRLKKQDLENSRKTNEIIKLKEAIQQNELEKVHLSKKLERISSEFDDHRKLMASEIFKLRKLLSIKNTQQHEYLQTFNDFRQILNSLPFE